MDNVDKEISYFKIGAFVLVGVGLIIFALLVFGSSKILEPIVYIETYFEESIQGISEGTPVKYRGLQIGHVKNIAFASEIYKDNAQPSDHMHARSIYVRIDITSKLFTNLPTAELREFISREVEKGLRVRLVVQGLTGTSYLELDYVNAKNSQIPKITWKPKDFYIPSVTSTLTRLSENAQYIMNELKDIDFKKIFDNMDHLLVSLDRVAGKTEGLLDRTDQTFIKTLRNLKIISDNLQETSNRLKLKPSEIVFSSYPPPLDPGKL